MEIMKTPNNCLECEYGNNCYSYYGGSMCKHKEEINKRTIEEFNQRMKSK